MSIHDCEWDYCGHCRRLEPVTEHEVLVDHDESASYTKGLRCEGSGGEPAEQPGPDVPPVCKCATCTPKKDE
ncbi:hypothetical protein [Streptomyces microflavus]|uniref:hypothetical protein n=1 Tax=Streptomyces microflavus TaxID=1919 RepID=UPI003678DA44